MEKCYYSVNPTGVVHEVIDGEVVIANINNGNYYSIENSGAIIWELIISKVSHDEIIDCFEKQYSDENVSTLVNKFIDELKNEEIIFLETGVENNTTTNTIQFPDKFMPPKLEKFTDMQALLTLDPIHEVELTGWPNTISEE